MKYLVSAFAALLMFMSVSTPADAGSCKNNVNCSQPAAVGKGQKVPTWHVVNCLTGPKGVPIACNDPKAVHKSPRGDNVVCFLGSDDKIHWDHPKVVYKGRPFINLRRNGIWQPKWTMTKAEKDFFGIK